MELAVIQNRIHEIRGQRVMLDFDLAEMYGIENKYLKRAVRNNPRRFPADFMFELTKDEWTSLRCNFSTLNKGRGQHPKYMPYAFTEQGVAMLSSVLNSDLAIEVNINIMRAFVAIRQGLPKVSSNKELEELKTRIKELEKASEETMTAINDLSEDTRRELDDIYKALSEMAVKQKKQQERPQIGYQAIKEQRERNK